METHDESAEYFAELKTKLKRLQCQFSLRNLAWHIDSW